MHQDTAARNGARRIITTGLSLSPGQELLILFDETTMDVAHLLLGEAQDLGVHPAAAYIRA
jgi:leucyl aminopeptidase (aminopeptidase T)